MISKIKKKHIIKDTIEFLDIYTKPLLQPKQLEKKSYDFLVVKNSNMVSISHFGAYDLETLQ